MFGVQAGGYCMSSEIAERNYRKHGPSDRCKNGVGGGWANDVYHLSSSKIKSLLTNFMTNRQN